jgi:cytosine/adenosine deaminase-related metal-dependent hydrolase
MSTILIQNGYLVTMNGDLDRFQGDILIQDNQIVRVAPHIETEADRIVDASGRVVLPDFAVPHPSLPKSASRAG